jgi:hypothetical protein
MVSGAPSGGFLVEANHVSCRIAKPRCDLGSVRTNRLHNLASLGDDHVEGSGYTVDHDVNEKARFCSGRAPAHPCAAHLAGRVVKGCAAITAFSNVPCEPALVEVGGARNVSCGNFDVADLAIGERVGGISIPSKSCILAGKYAYGNQRWQRQWPAVANSLT